MPKTAAERKIRYIVLKHFKIISTTLYRKLETKITLDGQTIVIPQRRAIINDNVYIIIKNTH